MNGTLNGIKWTVYFANENDDKKDVIGGYDDNIIQWESKGECTRLRCILVARIMFCLDSQAGPGTRAWRD
jgi:hypothetical protein